MCIRPRLPHREEKYKSSIQLNKSKQMFFQSQDRENKRSGREILHYYSSCLGDAMGGNINIFTTVRVQAEEKTTLYYSTSQVGTVFRSTAASDMLIFAVYFYDVHYLLSQRLFFFSPTHLRLSNQQLSKGRVTSCVPLM